MRSLCTAVPRSFSGLLDSVARYCVGHLTDLEKTGLAIAYGNLGFDIRLGER